MPYLIKRKNVYYAQRKVPRGLERAVAVVLRQGKSRQSYLLKSLGTEDRRQANISIKPVLIQFDRVIRAAEALSHSKPPARASLSAAEIERMAEYVFATDLQWDERIRVGGRDELKRMLTAIRKEASAEGEDPDDITPAYRYDELPKFGISVQQLADNREQLVDDLKVMREALALSDISAVQDQVAQALDEFGIDLDPDSTSFPALGIAVLRAHVRALEAIEKGNAGHSVETPVLPRALVSTPAAAGGTLRNAIEGWEKERERPPNTLLEYRRSVEMFIQLHGDLLVSEIRKSHARQFREALQLVPVPRLRRGPLREATLPALSDWGRKHPEAPKVSAGTINKQLGAVQAIAGWAHHNGIISDDVPWADPFQKMRVEEEQSGRTSFVASELQALFGTPLFTAHEWPIGAKGAAGVWLPLLALFTGARQAEIAGLQASNVQHENDTPLLYIIVDRKAGKRLKTKVSERVIPVHPQLVKLGLLKYVKERAREGERAWLFPTVSPDQRRALPAWSKWFSRYLRTKAGVTDTNKVFHSFRHAFQDALRRATPDEELRDAIQGRSNQKSVSRGYGAKEMLDRWGAKMLSRTMSKISYPGLNLSHVRAFAALKRKRGSK